MRYFELHAGTRYTGEDFFEYWKCEGDIRDVWRGKLIEEARVDNADYWYGVHNLEDVEDFEDWLADCYCEVSEIDSDYVNESEWNTVIWDESYEDGDSEGWTVVMAEDG